jgi:Holliday junction resolvase RusA-like endonuclease
MLIKKQIKPLSVNECWQGQRFKTQEYKDYEKELLYSLPALKLPKPPYSIYFEFGFSSSASDWDNPVKPLQDILQKKYGFDDKEILEARISKKKVSKGKEYFVVKLESLNINN